MEERLDIVDDNDIPIGKTVAPLSREYAEYHVAQKFLLKKGDEALFLTFADFPSKFDLPGGRIDTVEHEVPLCDILAREIREELGDDLVYTLGAPVMQFRRHVEKKGWHIFVTVFEADYFSGEIVLSEEHGGIKWLNLSTHIFGQEEFFGEEEYLAFKQYSESLKR